ncbi:UDP-3-O-(3-hydroxymyristoyl)glucosamine N-acyltransferase [Salinisphaera sp.]|uniref:UDP-3-O-(3-hydroxymyristoyl)glucosamine N-acyltransferase n=1 Tax=Salinisphaera sp. TaxID=1914330 RepID=UPI000C47156A|nr:UDP-3-O-(3-hydroxymyristoyl)glucosamine N-acyltransferase [Salinisphaera sp.]MBS63043.1 UDP-3-O-(3-hydroxymyristoyl)glucosamine N-acyltransferase [Salinisphaera sp.]
MATNTSPALTLEALAERFDLAVSADAAQTAIVGVCALEPGKRDCIAFAENAGQIEAIRRSAAAAVICPPAVAEAVDIPALVAKQPRLAFARVAALFDRPPPRAGMHPRAVVADTARVDEQASIAANVVIGENSVIEAGAVIGANTVIGDEVHIGADSRIASNCSIGDRVHIGARVSIEANAVIGGRGFGLVHNGAGWEPIPQMGRVRIGDEVEIGAGSTIDRGALDDTVIEQGVKIDNQVHIAHNCRIGAHTVVAGCTGIAGSCTIGSNCMIGGGVGIGDHVTIADGVIVTAASQVPKNIDRSGVYSSTFRAMPAAGWRKRLALFRQLDKLERRLRRVERATPSSENNE